MNFIEKLKSVGGVKLCSKCAGGYIQHINREAELCNSCHGKTYTLDLSPLLAKPNELEYVVKEFIHQYSWGPTCAEWVVECCKAVNSLYVVGPQRAHSLVYEVARQLGGCAVVAEPRYECTPDGPDSSWSWSMKLSSYRLSLPIPDSATVLFVTERWDTQEMSQVNMAVRAGEARFSILAYILCLVSSEKHFDGLEIVSLHQETP